MPADNPPVARRLKRHVAIGSTLGFVVFRLLFWNAPLFDVLWAGAATGSILAILIGSARDPAYLTKVLVAESHFGSVIAAIAVFATAAFLVIEVIPDLLSQERELAIIRQLSARGVDRISVERKGQLELLGQH